MLMYIQEDQYGIRGGGGGGGGDNSRSRNGELTSGHI